MKRGTTVRRHSRMDGMHWCSHETRQHKPCPIPADRNRNGKWVCHVHDPRGKFQKKKQDRKEAWVKRQRIVAWQEKQPKRPRRVPAPQYQEDRERQAAFAAACRAP